ncbi:hypothetical protein LNTAR_06699 [Lentisphaera araneosa HTCC2155]|uniref:Golvesin/Xly CBD-like domain-containing protein n=1 Tax=Lentisphaera araneosa HTCC2155 TaxID=313628 RepID=A6DNG6_9BACT|nr:FAD-dependent oxidoreductase [Lentisphaera araneosa]EDM26914.1 hypothetical protein LNTAR_06699 [Lentisphaera araneosa HTCC2155]
MDRRQFLKSKIAGTAILASSGLVFKADAQNLPTQSTENPDMLDVDVLVVGGGSAGHVAAIQAGRMGAKTVLLERGSQLGGTTTTGGVCFPGLFHAWGKQLISGIGWELVKKSREVDCKPLQDFSVANKGHVYYHVNINGQLYSLLAEEACLDAGVSLAYYQFPEKVTQTSNGWLVDVVGQGVRYQLRCKQIIDCSGGATVAGMLGMERMRGEERQPGTHSVIYKGFDMNVVNKNKKKIQEMYKQAVKEGRLQKGDTWSGNAFQPIRSTSGNVNHIFGADSSTAATQTQTNLAGRKSVLRMLKFLKTIPGGENATIDRMMTETASRETYRIKGERVLTVNDYTSGRTFKDSLCYSFYPIDLHDKNGVKPQKLKPGTFPTIPRSCLIPKGSKNFMVAGRSVSSDRLANSAARVQATCMAMGQATAVTAVLAARQGKTPGDVDLAEIRVELIKNDAIVIGGLKSAKAESQETNSDSQEGNKQVLSGDRLLVDAVTAHAVGSWKKSSNSKPAIGSNYLHDNNQAKGENSLTFDIKVEKPGRYDIKLFYSAHETRANNVPVSISIGGQVTELKVNQQKSDDGGFVLGQFDIQDDAKIVISNANTSGFVIVDGLEFKATKTAKIKI